MEAIRVIDVVDDEGFRRIPPCADPGFDHRSCDYWEDAATGSTAAPPSWLQVRTGARNLGLTSTLIDAVCDDLESRGFAAVETYPEVGAEPNATSAATPVFWESLGFVRAVDDPRFPVMRREFG